MYTLITIFYISLIGMIVMLVLKGREDATGKANVVSRLGRGTDHIFHKFFAIIKRGVSYLDRKTFTVVAHWIAYHILLRIRNVYVEVKSRVLANAHGRKVLDAVRGRGEVNTRGASIYLRRISAEGRK